MVMLEGIAQAHIVNSAGACMVALIQKIWKGNFYKTCTSPIVDRGCSISNTIQATCQTASSKSNIGPLIAIVQQVCCFSQHIEYHLEGYRSMQSAGVWVSTNGCQHPLRKYLLDLGECFNWITLTIMLNQPYLILDDLIYI